MNGTLAVMVSCPKATYETVEPILKHFGKLFYTGDKPGTAQTAKLANNLMAAAALVITSEAVAMGVKGGVNAKVLIDIINASSGRNSASEDKFPRAVLPGTFDFGFTTGLSYKDVRLCVDEAEAMGVPMVCGAVVRQMLAITNAKYRRVIRLHVDRESPRGMGRRGNARLDSRADRGERDCDDDRPDRIRRGIAGASVGAGRACRRSRPFRCGRHRQGENLPAGFSLLRVRGTAIIPGAARRSASRAPSRAAQPSSGPARSRHQATRPSPMRRIGHGLVREDMHAASICHHGVVIWPTLLALSERTTLSGATFLAAAIIGYEAGAQIGARAVYRRSGPPLPADRAGSAARRGAGGKLCARSHRGCRNQRDRHCRQYVLAA